MGLLKKLLGGREDSDPFDSDRASATGYAPAREAVTPRGVVMLSGGRRINAVGEASYQAALSRCVGGKCEEGWDEEVIVHLYREPSNHYDANAIKVMVGEELVGYLCRADAVAYQPMLRDIEAAGQVVACKGRIVGGWYRPVGGHSFDEGYFGIWLDLPTPA